MKKKATLVVAKPYMNNNIFDSRNHLLNRDDCLVPFHFLQKEFSKKGYDLSTQDINPVKNSEIVIYNELPKNRLKISKTKKSFLIMLESPLIIQEYSNISNDFNFNKIFTWNDSIVDHKKFVKINYSFLPPTKINTTQREKFCTLISAHKIENHKNELYSERIKTIRWFENNAPKDFDLYGIGWDKPTYSGLFKILKKVPLVDIIIPFKKFISYKGKVESKNKKLQDYTFAICYENIENEMGYITEKIFDCFFAGTIPIYWGSKNIADYIPKNCFIDRTQFKDNKDMYNYLTELKNENIQEFRNNITNFLKSDQMSQFHVETFAKTITSNTIGSI